MFEKNNKISSLNFPKMNGNSNETNIFHNRIANEGSNIKNISNINSSQTNLMNNLSSNNMNKLGNGTSKVVFNNGIHNISGINHNINNINSNNSNNNGNNSNFLGKKQNFANRSIADMFNKSFDNTNQSTELIPKKIEFKLSHVLKGGEMEEIQKIEQKQIHSKENLYNNDQFQLSIDKPKGFNNVGNTCFLNSVLQSLCSTQILVSYLFKNNHLNNCQLSKQSVCILCQFHKLLLAINTCKNSSYTPMSIVQNIKVISKSLRIGRQEDSHEFLMKMLETLESSNLKDLKLKDTNFIKNLNDTHKGIIYDIFGGEVNSTVTCGQCKHKSVKKEDFYSISVVSYFL
jgi:ubiquitin C-terminal hydrolase